MSSYTKQTILRAIVGDPSPSLGDKFPSTEDAVLRFWLWIENVQRGASNKTPDKSKVLDKVVTEVTNHGKANGLYQNLDKNQKYLLRVRVRRLIKIAEKIRDSFGTKRKDVEDYIVRERIKLQSTFDFDLDASKSNNSNLTKAISNLAIDHPEFAEHNEPDEPDEPDQKDMKSDPDFVPNCHDVANDIDLKPFILACIQHNTSIRAAFDLYNGVLQVLKVTDQSKYVSREKIRCQIDKHGKELQRDHKNTVSEIEVAGFDGKTSDVRTGFGQKEKHEKISVIEMASDKMTIPKPRWVSHFLPHNSEGATIAMGLHQVLSDFNSLKSILGFNADGCPTNTGNKSGVIRTFETMIHREIQWIICVFHLGELVWCHLFEKIGKLSSFQLFCAIVVKTGCPKKIWEIRLDQS